MSLEFEGIFVSSQRGRVDIGKQVVKILIHEQLGIYKIQLPLPFRLNHVNCYAIKGSRDWCIIDTGLNTERCRQVWKQFMEEHEISGGDIKGIYLTHYHPDHSGAAGWLQQLSGATVNISEADGEAINRYWQPNSAQALAEMFVKNGMPNTATEDVISEESRLMEKTFPAPLFSHVIPGKKIKLGDYRYSVISVPGHTDGHIMFLNEEFGVLLSGDHLLPKITTIIGVWPDSAPNPLDNYLKSLRANRGYDRVTVLPAHGEMFTKLPERINQLEIHHADRLNQIKEAVGDGATAYEISSRVFRKNLSEREKRFAVAETLAHLMYWVEKHELQVTNIEGVNIFSKFGDTAYREV